MAISADPEKCMRVDALDPPAIERYSTAIQRNDDTAYDVPQTPENAPVSRLRGVFPVDGYHFPPVLYSDERAQITNAKWIDDHLSRCRIDLKRLLGHALTADEDAALVNAIARYREAGAIPYETTLVFLVFRALRGLDND